MQDMKKRAKMKMLKELKKSMGEDMHEGLGDKMKSMQKVTVASDSSEGLEKGLSKAQQILKKKQEMMDDEDEYKCGGAKYKDGGMSEEELKKLKKMKK